MLRSTRHTLAVVLVALSAAVMLCGPCLHSLPGWRHDAGLSYETDGDIGGKAATLAHAGSDDCPVCHFLAQAQLTVDPVDFPAFCRLGAFRSEVVSITTLRPLCRIFSPRGPPHPAGSPV